MNAYAEKLEIIQWITNLQDKTIIQKLKEIKNQSIVPTKDWKETISIEEQQSIERGIQDAINGKVTPHSEAKKRYEKWL